MSRALRIALVADVIADGEPLRAQLHSLQSYSRRQRLPMELVAYASGTMISDSRIRRPTSAADLIGDDYFARADLVLYSFGSRFDLFDSIHFVSRRSSAWVIYMGPPGPGGNTVEKRTGFYRQCVNLLLADGIFTLDARGLAEIESFGVDPSRSFLRHTVHRHLQDADLELMLDRTPAFTPEVATLADEDRLKLLRLLNTGRDNKVLHDVRITQALGSSSARTGNSEFPVVSPAEIQIDSSSFPSSLYLLLPGTENTGFARLAARTAHACANAAAASNVDCKILRRFPESGPLPATSESDVVVALCDSAIQASEVGMLQCNGTRCGSVVWTESAPIPTRSSIEWDFRVGAGKALSGHLRTTGGIARAFTPSTELETNGETWAAPQNPVLELAIRHGHRRLYVLPVPEHLPDAELVLDAFSDLWRRGRQLILVVAAMTDGTEYPAHEIFFKHPENGRRLHILSNLDLTSTELIYESATALICPDQRWRYDLELHNALSRGCTVIASQTPCHRDLAPGAIFFEARSACALSSRVDELDARLQREPSARLGLTIKEGTLNQCGTQLLVAISRCIQDMQPTTGSAVQPDSPTRERNTTKHPTTVN